MVRGFIWEKVAGWQALVLNLRVGRSCDQVLWRVHSYLQMFLLQHSWQFKFSTLLWKVQLVHSVSVFPRCSMECATRFPYNNSPWLKKRNEVDTMSECRVPTALLARPFLKLGSHQGLLTPNILILILPGCPKQIVWTALRELIVLQTLTQTRDHLPISPYCTTHS